MRRDPTAMILFVGYNMADYRPMAKVGAGVADQPRVSWSLVPDRRDAVRVARVRENMRA